MLLIPIRSVHCSWASILFCFCYTLLRSRFATEIKLKCFCRIFKSSSFFMAFRLSILSFMCDLASIKNVVCVNSHWIEVNLVGKAIQVDDWKHSTNASRRCRFLFLLNPSLFFSFKCGITNGNTFITNYFILFLFSFAEWWSFVHRSTGQLVLAR